MKEVNYTEVFIRLWTERKTIFKYMLVFLLIGLVIAIVTPKKYTVTTVIVPQLSSTQNFKLGNLSSLASLAGIDLSSLSSTEAISPLMYPKIVESLPFQIDLMKSTFYYKRAGKAISLMDYYKIYRKKSPIGVFAKYTFGLPSLILEKLKSKDISKTSNTSDSLLVINKDIEEIMKYLEKDISIEVNIKFGYVSLTGTFDDPVFTAHVVNHLKNLLQTYITKYKIERAMAKLKFVSERYNEKKAEFEEAQRRLALFRDRNKNVRTEIVRAEEERLTAEYNLAFNVYNELATQLEQAQIAVKEDTPIFTVIEPTKVPYKKSAPKRFFIIFVFTILGVCAGTGHVFYRMLDINLFSKR
ncbi:MAG: Wzz/FepE/Etk N-terminal domain-containing protein [Bacteroidales bacterium]|nr:Wzz/FepE/Etk N-terminal domain-containing protein [Bacteroidales bacterium]